METLNGNNLPVWYQLAFSSDSTGFFFNPPYTYENELAISGDIRSCRTSHINQAGLNFIGYTQAEVDQLGFNFYLQAVYPDDLKELGKSLKKKPAAGLNTLTFSVHRFRPKGSDQYIRIFCTKVVKETFSDGSLKRVVVGAQMVSQLSDTAQVLLLLDKDFKQSKFNETFDCLTPREKEVLELVLNDKTNKEIATLLFVSVATIKNHRYNMMQKLGVHSIAALAGLAFKNRVY